MKQQIFRNALFNAIGRFWLIGTNLVLTPLILSYLGQDRFAVWALVLTLIHYGLLLDLGLGTALVKHFAECRGRDDQAAFVEYFNSAFFFYLGLGAVEMLVLWPVVARLVPSAGLPADTVAEAVRAFQFGILGLILLHLVVLFDAVLKGLQKLEATNLTAMAVSLPNLAGSYWVLRQGWGLPGLALVMAGVFGLQALLLGILSRWHYPALRLSWREVRGGVIARLFVFGTHLQVPRIAELVRFHADKVLLAFFLPIRFVTFYDLGSKVASVIQDLPYILFNALFPAASHLAGQEDHRRLWLLYERGTKYLLLVSLPLLAGLWLTAHLILQVWLGHVSAAVHRAVLILAAGYWGTIAVGMVMTVGAGLGWVKPIMRVGLAQVLLNLLLSGGLILAIGYEGVLIGTTVTTLLTNAYLLVWFCRDHRLSVVRHLRLFLQAVSVNLLPGVAVLSCVLWARPWTSGGSRAQAFAVLIGCIGVYAVSYAASLRWVGTLDREDWELLGGSLPFMRPLVKMSA